jgi:hypothetical protein
MGETIYHSNVYGKIFLQEREIRVHLIPVTLKRAFLPLIRLKLTLLHSRER